MKNNKNQHFLCISKIQKILKPPSYSQTKAFLSIDIAFGLVIMSISFVILFEIQSDISKEMERRDVSNFLESNTILLENIRTNAGQRRVIKSDVGMKYEAVFFNSDSRSKNSDVMLHFYKPNSKI